MKAYVERHELTPECGFDDLPDYLPRGTVRVGVLKSNPMVLEVVRLSDDCAPHSISESKCRWTRRDREFVVVMIIPTGIGCAIGGHAGDAGAAARLMGTVVDTLVLHPNVVNASDINEMPDNALYVEGAMLTKFMMGTIGLARRRSNKIGVFVEEHEDPEIEAWVVNAARAAQRCYGADIEIYVRGGSLGLSTSIGTDGLPRVKMDDMGPVHMVIDQNPWIDAWAIASKVDIEDELAVSYLRGDVEVNPWGLAEAALTHSLGLMHYKPIAHAPMANTQAEIQRNVGIVDSRRAAEVVSVAYMNCVLKGLMRAPMIVSSGAGPFCDLEVMDVDVLIIPRGVLGLPVWAARKMGIPVIEVMTNTNLMENDLQDLKWEQGMHYRVRTYAEAAGTCAALRAGIDPRTTEVDDGQG